MYKRLILFVFSMVLVSTHQKKIKLKLFYESLCSDSQNFINSFFTCKVPALLPYVDIEYIPYGKASHSRNSNGGYDFTCQHGPLECFGNKVHACVTSQSNNLLKTSEFVDCAMTVVYYREDYEDQLRQCADRSGFNWNAIDNCARSDLGSQILANYGEITHSYDGKLKFVPTVMVNNKIIVDDDGDFHGFFKEICRILHNKPSECSQTTHTYY